MNFEVEFNRDFKKKSKHFNAISDRRFNLLWENNNLSLIKKLEYRIKSNFYAFYFDDILPGWRKTYRNFTKNFRYKNIDFFILSPIKVGSSQLALTLFSNPEIVSPVVKEFLLRGPNHDSKYYPLLTDDYKKAGYIAPFLIEPFYRDRNFTLNLIKKYYPDSKLIIALRNPIKRAFSHWKWEYFLAGKKNTDKIEFLKDFNLYVDYALKNTKKEPTNFSGFPFLKSGLYYELLCNSSKDFKNNNIYFLDMDVYFREPNSELDKLQRFINLSKSHLYPKKLPTVNENPLKFDKSSINQITIDKLKSFYYQDIKNINKFFDIGKDWLTEN